MLPQRRVPGGARRSAAATLATWLGRLATVWCLAVPSAHAQINLTFDWSQLGNPTLSGTFSGTAFNLTSLSGSSAQVETAGTWGSSIKYDGFV